MCQILEQAQAKHGVNEQLVMMGVRQYLARLRGLSSDEAQSFAVKEAVDELIQKMRSPMKGNEEETDGGVAW
jgi:hypothetical protein